MRTPYLLLLILTSCRYLDNKIIQESDLNPNNITTINQPIQVMSKSEPLIIINLSQPWKLSWSIDGDNTNLPQDGLEFDVEKCTDLNNPTWSLYCRTNQPPVPFFFSDDSGFFRVGSHSIKVIPMPAPFRFN